MKTKNLMIMVLISLVWAAAASALDVSIEWEPNMDSDLAGYKVYYGVNGLANPEHIDVLKITEATITDLDPALSYSFAVAAYNASGFEGPYSNVITSLESILPVVSITNPTNNAKVSNTVEVSASASDNVGVVKVEFYVNDALKATETAEPYQFAWDTLAVTPGLYYITAMAYDAAGNVGFSSISVNVVNDLTPPTISYSAPLQGSRINGAVAVSCNASDDVGVIRVEFYVNGVMDAAFNLPPYSYVWDTHTVSDGFYVLTAKAYDAADHVVTSTGITVSVNNLAADTIAPTVSIRVSKDNSAAIGMLLITAIANDDVGVSRVEFYVNGSLMSTATTAPYAFGWNSISEASGSYILMTKAYDAAGNFGQSASLKIAVPNVKFR